MKLKETAFGTHVSTANSSTPDFGQDLGQGSNHWMKLEGFPDILNGMVYYKVDDIDKIECVLGKGTRVNTPLNTIASEKGFSIVLASVFKNIYVNGKELKDSQFIMFITKEEKKTDSTGKENKHYQRRQLKFPQKATYRGNSVNEDCMNAITKALGCSDNGSWIITDMNMDEEKLLFSAVVIDYDDPYDFKDIADRAQHLRNKVVYIAGNGKHTEKTPIASETNSKLIIYFGAPGTGKSYTINKQVGGEDNPNVIRTTFHPDSDYSSFVGCYKPIEKDNTAETEITYKFSPQAFTKAYVKAWSNPIDQHFLIIEEINRGNCAQIFGDIFQLLDRNSNGESSYTISPDNDLQKYLEEAFANIDIVDDDIKSGRKMKLPSNLSIYATMNTSDQSLFPIDSAFKRRWDWKYIPINKDEEGHYIECGNIHYDWWAFLEKVNPKIDLTTGSEDKQLGFWFAKPDDESGKISAEKFVSKVVFYLWNDVFKDYTTDGNNVFKTENGLLKFRQFFDRNGDVNIDTLRFFFENCLGLEPESEYQGEDTSDEDASGLFSVTFSDGTRFREDTQFDTYFQSLKKIGLENAEIVASTKKYTRLNNALISKTKGKLEPPFSYVENDNFYIIKGIDKKTMINMLNQISEHFDLELTIE